MRMVWYLKTLHWCHEHRTCFDVHGVRTSTRHWCHYYSTCFHMHMVPQHTALMSLLQHLFSHAYGTSTHCTDVTTIAPVLMHWCHYYSTCSHALMSLLQHLFSHAHGTSTHNADVTTTGSVFMYWCSNVHTALTIPPQDLFSCVVMYTGYLNIPHWCHIYRTCFHV